MKPGLFPVLSKRARSLSKKKVNVAFAGSVLAVFAIGSCSAYAHNMQEREDAVPVSPPAVVKTVYQDRPVPGPTVQVTQQVQNPADPACKLAGQLAEQVRTQTSVYTKAVGAVPRALSEAQKGAAMNDLKKLNRAQAKLEKADNESTEALQKLIELDGELKKANEACPG